jgi:hypothetical protein
MSDFSVFEFENNLILWWHKRMTTEGVEECVRLGERMMARGKIGFLTLIDPGVDLNAPSDGRRAMASFLSRNEQRIAAAAVAYEASGFKATAVRSIITAVNLASRSSFPNKVFSDTTEAMEWLAESTGTPGPAADRLKRAIELRRPQLAS